MEPTADSEDVIVDLLDVLLQKGVILEADVVIGIADIPLFIGTSLVGVGETIGGSAVEGTGILGVVDQVVSAGVGFASAGGPLAPIILSAEVVLVVWVIAVLTRRTILVIADAVPGLAGVFGT